MKKRSLALPVIVFAVLLLGLFAAARAEEHGLGPYQLLTTIKMPGDLISAYATAKSARLESHTDMVFVQVDPFEREFSQSQQA